MLEESFTVNIQMIEDCIPKILLQNMILLGKQSSVLGLGRAAAQLTVYGRYAPLKETFFRYWTLLH